MATSKETVAYILQKLGNSSVFSIRAMFGEYALYANGKVVGFICDNKLYIKILPESFYLDKFCVKDNAYPGSKLYYLVEEDQLSTLEELPELLLKIAQSLPEKRKKIF